MRVAERARDIVRTTSRSDTRFVKPPDAIHLASAEIHGCHDFFTYEGETTRERWGHWADVVVAEPYTENPQLDLNWCSGAVRLPISQSLAVEALENSTAAGSG